MRTCVRGLSGILFAAGLACAGAAEAISFTNVVSLGDSLLDDGTFGDQRSPVVSQHIAGRVGAAHTQLAVGGSTTSSLITQGQHTAAAASFGAGDLAVVWIGGNDFLANGNAIAFGNFSFLNTAEANLGIILSTLTGAGMDVVVFNLPDFSGVPQVQLNVPSSLHPNFRAAALDWQGRVDALGALYGVAVVDVFTFSDALAADPSAFAVGGQDPILGPTFGPKEECSTCMFYDAIHPSSLAQGYIANAAFEAMNAFFDPGGADPIAPLSEAELLLLVPEPSAGWLLAAAAALAARRRYFRQRPRTKLQTSQIARAR
jgi:phospholipase/lecithinase/hemolysin